MNRRGFISLLAGAAGAPLVPWRGIIEPLIVLPPRRASDYVMVDGRAIYVSQGFTRRWVDLPQPWQVGQHVQIFNLGEEVLNVRGAGEVKPHGVAEAFCIHPGAWVWRAS